MRASALIGLLLGVCCLYGSSVSQGAGRGAAARKSGWPIWFAGWEVTFIPSEMRPKSNWQKSGAAAREHLLAAVESPDPEIRLRAKKLLRGLRINELWAPTQVQHPADQTAASAALMTIGRQTGNRVLAGDQYGTFHDRIVTMERLEGTFWEMIDQLCRSSGNRVRPHYDTRRPGLVLASGQAG